MKYRPISHRSAAIEDRRFSAPPQRTKVPKSSVVGSTIAEIGSAPAPARVKSKMLLGVVQATAKRRRK